MSFGWTSSTCHLVALRKESVDRNIDIIQIMLNNGTSLSARRAWIEMRTVKAGTVARVKSLSARRAWIEIVDSGEIVKQFDGRSPQGERG